MNLYGSQATWFNPRFIFIALFFCAFLLVSSSARAEPYTILSFGDSLMSGYGIDRKQAFPAQLEAKLIEKGYDVRVINAGKSGDTTTGGLKRLDWSLQDNPDLVILELGANDARRGINPQVTYQNLGQMIYKIRSKNIHVLLAGMYAPPNMGATYSQQFNAIYPTLAQYYSINLYPFFLQGVATQKHLNLKDGVHPNTQGIAVIVQGILPYVEVYLKAPESHGQESHGQESPEQEQAQP